MNNYNKKAQNYQYNINNARKLNIKSRDKNNKSLVINVNQKENNVNTDNNQESFIASTLLEFNGLVSKAQKIGQILINNKDILKASKDNDLIKDQLKNSFEILDVNNKIEKLDKKIEYEKKTVEELQKINVDLNNKMNLFNENSHQYKNKVKELDEVINQLKQTTNSNNSNNNASSSNYDNTSSNQGSQVIQSGDNNKYKLCRENDSLFLEKKPKKKKIKFGFVESIFMKQEKLQIINKEKKSTDIKENKDIINNSHKEKKLVFINMNKGNSKEKSDYTKITKEEYEDAASQMANLLLIESLSSLEQENNKDKIIF
jgi:hypothetical protein